MLIYEVITGKQPFAKISAYEIPSLVCKGQRPPLPSSLAKPWHKLITSMWSDKPSKRPTMTKVASFLAEYEDLPFIASSDVPLPH